MAYLLNIRRKYIPNGTITRRSIADANVTISANSFPYTGDPITPGVTVIVSGTVLSANVDYILEYRDNVDVGQGKVVLTGIGDYYGMKEATFYITSGARPSGSWDFDITKTVVKGYKKVPTSQILKSMRILPVKKDGSEVFMCSYGTYNYTALLTWDGTDVSSLSFVDGTEARSGYEIGGLTNDGINFSMTSGGNGGTFYKQALSEYLGTQALDKETATRCEGFSNGITQISSFGFANEGTRFYVAYANSTMNLYRLQNPFDLSVKERVFVDPIHVASSMLKFSPDGMSAVTVETIDGQSHFVKYSMDDEFYFPTATKVGSIQFGAGEGIAPVFFDVDESGTKIVSVVGDRSTLYVHNLSK